MIAREHPLSVARQANLLEISRGQLHTCPNGPLSLYLLG